MAKAKPAPAAAAPKPKKASSKPKIDFQDILLQHGERIGVGSAIGLTLLLIVLWLFMPGSGLFSGSPTEKAVTLDKMSESVERQLRDPNNLPGDADKPPPDADKKRVDLDTSVLDGSGYQVSGLIPDAPGMEMGRRQPVVKNISEGRAAVARVQVKTFLFSQDDPTRIYVLKNKPGTGGAAMGPGAGGELGGAGGKGTKGGMPGGAMGGMPGAPGGGLGGAGGAGALAGIFGPKKKPKAQNLFGKPADLDSDDKDDKQPILVSTRELSKHSDKSLAVQVRPLRMAIIAASFPYKEQVEEFKSKLGLRTPQDVLSEASSVPGKDKQAQYAFRFASVLVQRRELDIDGKPVAGKEGEWRELNLNEDYKPYVVLTDKDFEQEDPTLSAISFTGLVMPRLRQFGGTTNEPTGVASGPSMPGVPGMPGALGGGKGGSSKPGSGGPAAGDDKGKAPAAPKYEDQYPAIEKELPELKKTLDKLKDKLDEVAAPQDKFGKLDDDFDLFQGRSSGKAAAPAGGIVGGDDASGGGPAPESNPGGMPDDGKGGATAAKAKELPEHCLVRLVDVTIQPGRTYEYRMKVRMANPNWKRRDVASPTYAKTPILESPEWSKLAEPITVHVDREMEYFAIDQMAVERFEAEKQSPPAKAPKYNGPYRNLNIQTASQIFLQAHRWIESIPSSDPNRPIEVGEWAVAERIPVSRGEYIGRSERVELPVWRFTREDFVLAKNASTSKSSPGINVNFGYSSKGDLPEAILVDFENGGQGHHKVMSRNEERPDVKKTLDTSAGEVLIMTPEGKLILRETARDAADETRKARVEKVRTRVKNIKDGGTEAGKDKKGGFGDGAPPGGGGT